MNRHVDIPPLNPNHFRSTESPDPFGTDGGGNSGRRAVVAPSHRSSPAPSHRSSLPPISPYSKIPTTRQTFGSQNFSPGPRISRSMSQPSNIFSLNSMPAFSPSSASFRDSPSAPLAGYGAPLPPFPFTMSPNSARFSGGSTLPPRKAHKRSISDFDFGFDPMVAQNPPKSPIEFPVGERSEEEGITETKAYGEAMDELFTEYMNLDKVDDASKGDDMERNSSEGSIANEIGSATLGVKRRAGKDIAPSGRHYRSVSVDSCVNWKPPLSPVRVSATNSVDGNENALSTEFGNCVFTEYEWKKIAGSDKLKELVVSDPKQVKRILANRNSAARSKEKKARYITELELKVQTLQTEATTASTDYKHLKRDYMVLENHSKELTIRLQGREKEVYLCHSLIGHLKEEVQLLKMGETGAVSQNRSQFDRSNMQQSMNANRFQQLNINQLHQQQRNPDFQ